MPAQVSPTKFGGVAEPTGQVLPMFLLSKDGLMMVTVPTLVSKGRISFAHFPVRQGWCATFAPKIPISAAACHHKKRKTGKGIVT